MNVAIIFCGTFPSLIALDGFGHGFNILGRNNSSQLIIPSHLDRRGIDEAITGFPAAALAAEYTDSVGDQIHIGLVSSFPGSAPAQNYNETYRH